jgi:peptide/nickel transport system substrate-binding protein
VRITRFAASLALAFSVSIPLTAVAQQSTPAANATPVRGGTLTMSINPEPPFLLNAINSTLQMGMVATKIMEGLVYYDHDLNPKPQLAESWEMSPDGLSYRFNLRKGVKWHDGKDFTSADVVFSLTKAWKPLHPRGRTTFAKVIGVDAPDAHTVVIRLSEPTPQLMTALSAYEAQVFPKHVFDGTDIPQNPAVNAPIGTGPFVFKEWKKGGHIIVERNPNYWEAGKPYLDRIVFRFINDASSRAAALESGEVQIGGLSPVPLADVIRISKLPHIEIETRGYDYMSPIYLMELNMRRGPLADVRVRRALAHAVDRNALTRVVWFGYGAPAVSPVPSTIKKFHSPPEDVKYPFDLKRAEALLDEAGLRRGSDGKRFKLMLDWVPLGSDYQRSAEFLKQQLARVGVDIEIRSSDLPTYVKRIYGEYDYDIALGYYGAFPDPTQGLQRIFWSKAVGKGVVFTNANDYRNPEMDQILEAAQTENDPKKRFELFARMQRIAMADLPVVPLMEMRFFTVANRKVMNHTIGADGIIGGNFANTWLAK